jgi:glutamyl-tRNA reductase
MSMGPIVPAVDLLRAPTPADEPASALDEHSRSGRPASAPHRHHAAALIRQIGGRTEAALRRELGRLFAARPDLSLEDRVAIARALSRFRNQLLHHSRSTLRAAASAPDPAAAHPLLDAVRRLFGLADARHSDPAEPRTPGDRPTRAPADPVAC